MRRKRRRGFTLVELLVVVGILAVLISILLPALNKARQAGMTIKCAANLHSIGQAMALYTSENKGSFPAAYMYVGQTLSNNVDKNSGYVHWSSFLYKKAGNDDPAAANSMYRSLKGWDMFLCPSMYGGGLPPANTYTENLEAGQVNSSTNGIIDQQSPRTSYTVNEAIIPRNKFYVGYNDGDGSGPATRSYHFVKFSQIKYPNHVILATEFIDDWKVVSTVTADATTVVCKSHRPVHAYVGAAGELDMFTLPTASFNRAGVLRAYRVTPANLNLTPTPNGASQSRLDWVGRNHGTDPKTAKTNFLYCDGHVETKRIEETLAPQFEWGAEFYSLTQNGDIEHHDAQ